MTPRAVRCQLHSLPLRATTLACRAQDFINRYQTLQGRKVRYVPGWDCHGLPIELKVLQSMKDDERKALTPIKLRQKVRSPITPKCPPDVAEYRDKRSNLTFPRPAIRLSPLLC